MQMNVNYPKLEILFIVDADILQTDTCIFFIINQIQEKLTNTLF